MKASRRLTMCSKSGRDSRKEPFRQLPSMPTLRLQGGAGWMRPALPSAWRWACR